MTKKAAPSGLRFVSFGLFGLRHFTSVWLLSLPDAPAKIRGGEPYAGAFKSGADFCHNFVIRRRWRTVSFGFFDCQKQPIEPRLISPPCGGACALTRFIVICHPVCRFLFMFAIMRKTQTSPPCAVKGRIVGRPKTALR